MRTQIAIAALAAAAAATDAPATRTVAQLTCDGYYFGISTVAAPTTCVREAITGNQTVGDWHCSKADDAADAAADAGMATSCGDLDPSDPIGYYDETNCDLMKEANKDVEGWPSDDIKATWAYMSVCGATMTAVGAAVVAAAAVLAF